jgi:hypothetical protein
MEPTPLAALSLIHGISLGVQPFARWTRVAAWPTSAFAVLQVHSVALTIMEVWNAAVATNATLGFVRVTSPDLPALRMFFPPFPPLVRIKILFLSFLLSFNKPTCRHVFRLDQLWYT